jgi:hypothetical protein
MPDIDQDASTFGYGRTTAFVKFWIHIRGGHKDEFVADTDDEFHHEDKSALDLARRLVDVLIVPGLHTGAAQRNTGTTAVRSSRKKGQFGSWTKQLSQNGIKTESLGRISQTVPF